MAKIILNLLDNGIDYIYEAVKPMLKEHDKTKHLWKYSVLHLYSGIELLLKEKLRQEHWSLIFQDISNASLRKLENGDFVSVYHEELIKRLRNISEISFDDKPIKELRDLRNRFEHFEVDIPLSECQYIVAAALEEIIKFWEIYLTPVSTLRQQEEFKAIKEIATSFEVYKNHRLNKFKEVIIGIVESKNGVIVGCPDCSSLSFVVFKDNERECKCFVCDERYSKDDYLKKIRNLEEYRQTALVFCDEPYDITCPCCQKETRIRYMLSGQAIFDEIAFYWCLNCLNREKVDPEFKERFRNAPREELLSILEYHFVLEAISQMLQDYHKP